MEIDLRPACIRINGCDVIDPPSKMEFLKMVGATETDCRHFGDTGSGNSVCVVDELGLFFLYSTSVQTVELFALRLERPKWRNRTDRDPAKLFTGELRVDGRLLPRPVTTTMAGLIARRNFATASVRLTPHGNTIASVIVSFLEAGKRPFSQN